MVQGAGLGGQRLAAGPPAGLWRDRQGPLRLALPLLLGLALLPRLDMSLHGDEPHYLMTTLSMVKDFDLNLFNNYQAGHFRELGYPELKPQWGPLEGRIIPEHGVGFPALLALPYLLGGVAGVKLFLVALSLATAWLLAALCDAFGCRRWVGTVAAALLCLSPSWLLHAGRVFPETSAGFFFVAAALALARSGLRLAPPGPALTLGLGLLCGLLPLLYLKYTPLALALGLFALAQPGLRRRPLFYLGLLADLALYALILWGVYGSELFWGTGGEAEDFTTRGMAGRYGRQWLDANHGLLVLQPAYALAGPALAGLLLLRGGSSPGGTLLAGSALLFYSLLHGLFTGQPGVSLPGRYLLASLPAQALLIGLWCGQDHLAARLCRWPLAGLGLAMLGFSLWCLAFGVSNPFRLNQLLAPQWYLGLFPALWPQ